MTTATWAPGTFYTPGSIVRPRSGSVISTGVPFNPSFEDSPDFTGWTQSSEEGTDSWTLDTSTSTSHVVTFSGGNPVVVGWTSNTLANGNVVNFTTTGTLPTGLTVGVQYYVVGRGSNIFEVSLTLGGSPINTTALGSGTHTVHASGGTAFDGDKSAHWVGNGAGSGPKGSVLGILKNNNLVPVTPGQTINFNGRIRRQTAPDASSECNGGVRIYWKDATMGDLGFATATTHGTGGTPAGMVGGTGRGEWIENIGSATVPAGAAFAQLAFVATGNGIGGGTWVDLVTWDYVYSGTPLELVFQAVQANAGFSAAAEPTWPTVAGDTVIDGDITWEAVLTSRIIWQAAPILVSGASEPIFPTTIGGTVPDNTIAWKAITRQITDPKCPNSGVVLIAASKVFAGDQDIVAYSATVNPLDWSTPNDAGYLPTGLQNYGSNPVAALGLYRSNLITFNAEGFQMWQIDPDPTSMAFLDAVPAGSTAERGGQAVGNDLLFPNPVGVRNISIAGASTNLQAGGVGEPIDSLVRPEIKANPQPISLYYPARGQYWLIFDERAYVLTINAASTKSWSRYSFPSAITDWTILGNDLYLRSGDLVWLYDEDALYDDQQPSSPSTVTVGLIGTTEASKQVRGFLNTGSQGGDIKNLLGNTFTHYSIDISELGPAGSIGNEPPGIGVDLVTIILDNPGGTGFGTNYSFVIGASSASAMPPDDLFADITFDCDIQHGGGGSQFPNSLPVELMTPTTYTSNVNGRFQKLYVFNWTVGSWGEGTQFWTVASTYNVSFTGSTPGVTGVDIAGLIQWPHLDMGSMGLEKNMEAFDLVATAPLGVQVSIGYNQNDLSQRTAPYLIDADTLPAMAVPFPVGGPSFDLQLTFPPGQFWEWNAALMYVSK